MQRFHSLESRRVRAARRRLRFLESWARGKNNWNKAVSVSRCKEWEQDPRAGCMRICTLQEERSLLKLKENA